MKQAANQVLMIRPAGFGFNAETAASNAFQHESALTPPLLLQQAQQEFDAMAAQLRSVGITVTVLEDTEAPSKPDAVFPNNWFCIMPDGSFTLFPMQAENRRTERTEEIIALIKNKYQISAFKDWSKYEYVNWFLESTGSMVMDHINRIIYACLSQRTHQQMVEKFAKSTGYTACCFNATDPLGNPIYHTNVIMHIGDGYAVLCGECITNHLEKERVYESLVNSGLIIIEISMHQVHEFAGNMLQVKNKREEKVTILSRRAYDSLSNLQIKALTAYTWLLPVPLDIIEKVGGGSVRCMLAEIFAKPIEVLYENDMAS